VLLERFPRVDAVFSSDLLRAVQTAEVVAAAYKLQVEQHTGLRERHMGVLQVWYMVVTAGQNAGHPRAHIHADTSNIWAFLIVSGHFSDMGRWAQGDHMAIVTCHRRCCYLQGPPYTVLLLPLLPLLLPLLLLLPPTGPDLHRGPTCPARGMGCPAV
jgi:hypothetical protein